jgi:hypothetical protein
MADDTVDMETLKKKYPESLGWDLIPLGNKVIAVNQWGRVRKVVHERPLVPEDRIPIPKSWRYKPRTE